ncbi:MAG: hypothetical protein AB7P23_08530 [Amphiplicatus sp.]
MANLSGSAPGRAVLLAAVLVLTVLPARAVEPGRREFAAGDFETARLLAREAGSGEGFALACQAGLVLGGYFEKGAAAVRALHGALEDCARSIASGAGRADAHINYAIALGFEAERLGSRTYASASRRLMEEAIARFPKIAFAHAAYAAWHAAAAERGFLAKAALGASESAARDEFETALALQADNFSVNYQALRFFADGGAKDRDRAARLAARLLGELRPKDRFEALLRERAQEIAEALATQDKKAVAAALQATEPFGGIEKERAAPSFPPPFLTYAGVDAAMEASK